jgi:hypothetical protein
MIFLPVRRWLLGLAIVVAAPYASAQDEATEPAKADDSGLVIVNEGETPPARILSLREDLMGRSQSALAQAVLFLRAQARKEDNRLFYGPYRTRKYSGTKDVELKYREEVVDIPIYKITYETYETIANVKAGGSTTGETSLQKVKRTREIRKQVDTKKETRLIRDNNGPITRVTKVAVYEPGGPDHLYSGFWGQNAQCILILAKLGVPLDEPDFAAGIQTLTNYVDGYGIPDRTYDVAWLTACFTYLAKLNPQHPQWPAIAKRLVTKLMLAQHQNDPAKGMWGVVAINNDLLANAILYERDLYNKEVSSWQEKLDKNPKSDYYIKKVKEGKERIRDFRVVLNDIAMQGLTFENYRGNMLITPPDDFLAKVSFTLAASTVSGMPIHFYSEAIADIECTAVAMMALREASDNGFLPARIDIPKTLEGKPLTNFPDTERAISQTAATLAKLQTKDGTWPEANFWFPVHSYDKIGLPELPVNDRKFVSLDSPVTQTSTVQGYQAMGDAVRLLGDSGFKQYAQVLQRGERPVLEFATAIEERKKNAVPAGGLYMPPPYLFVSHLGTALHGATASPGLSGLSIPRWCPIPRNRHGPIGRPGRPACPPISASPMIPKPGATRIPRAFIFNAT